LGLTTDAMPSGREHQIPPDRPQDHFGSKLPAFEGLVPRYLDRLSALGHPTASTRPRRHRKAATEPDAFLTPRRSPQNEGRPENGAYFPAVL
jgi:hypothetical protein